MIFGKPALRKSVDAFTAAVEARDSNRQAAFEALQQAIWGESRPRDAEWAEAGPRLAAVMEQLPEGPRGIVAVMVGACVEGGADPVVCAEPVLSGARAALENAAEFAERWEAADLGELPEPHDPESKAHTLLRDTADAELQRLSTGWFSLEQWERASVAMLSHQAVRQACRERDGLLAAAERLGGAEQLRCLVYSLLVLDEEPLIALHRPSRTGFGLRMSGIGDNFQLHTLLGGVLIGGRHLPGEAPTAQAVALCLDSNVAPQDRPPTSGSFNLVAPAGQWVWNEGTPSDIPVVNGVRLLVLDDAPYRRSWPAGRFFPGMPASLDLERVLAPDEVAHWFAGVAPASTNGR
ncbi:hypothetical protein [Streptacidiphilus sp. PAMC 29251]